MGVFAIGVNTFKLDASLLVVQGLYDVPSGIDLVLIHLGEEIPSRMPMLRSFPSLRRTTFTPLASSWEARSLGPAVASSAPKAGSAASVVMVKISKPLSPAASHPKMGSSFTILAPFRSSEEYRHEFGRY